MIASEKDLRIEHAWGNGAEPTRKVAVQPPIGEEEQELIKADSRINNLATDIRFETVEPEHSGVAPYTLISFEAEFPRAYATRTVAHFTGKVLERAGYNVAVDGEPKHLGLGRDREFFSASAGQRQAA